MRPESIVLLVAAALLACVDAASAATASKSTTAAFSGMTHSFSDNQDIISTRRFLRTSEAANEDDEERAGLDAITGLFKAGASKVVDTIKLNSWLLRNKDGVQVLNKLKLGDDIAAALKNKKLDTLSKYITMFNEKHPNSKISLIGTLTAHYGDDVVAKALVSARRAPITERMATRLQSQQLEGWLKSGKSVDDVYALLKLKQDGLAAVVSRKLEMLDDYIKLFNREKSADESVVKVMATGFGGEDKLATALENARLHPVMNAKAKKLQDAQFAQWLDEGYGSLSVLTTVFKVEGANLAGASRSQKSIVKQFKAYYEREMRVPNVVEPRRS